MRFPEWLYRLHPGDQGSQQLGIVWREATFSDTSAIVSATAYQVPNDKCLVLTNASMRFVGGGGQTVVRRRLFSDPPDGTVRYNVYEASVGAATVLPDNWQGEVIIPGGWKVKAEGGFSAGVASNETSVEIHGYLIPRGTFIFG